MGLVLMVNQNDDGLVWLGPSGRALLQFKLNCGSCRKKVIKGKTNFLVQHTAGFIPVHGKSLCLKKVKCCASCGSLTAEFTSSSVLGVKQARWLYLSKKTHAILLQPVVWGRQWCQLECTLNILLEVTVDPDHLDG